MVYFIGNRNNNTIKIGYSNNPKRRLKELQTANADKLFLIGYINGDKSLENILHNMFERVSHEWFKPTDSLLDFINDNTLTDNYVEYINDTLMIYKRMKLI